MGALCAEPEAQLTQPERVSGTLASKKGQQGQPGCTLEPWPTWPRPRLAWSCSETGTADPSVQEEGSLLMWVPPSGCRELGTGPSDFTPSPLVAPRACPEQRLPSKVHVRSAEAKQPLDSWRQGQREGTFINTVPLSQVTVTATIGTRSVPKAKQSQKSPTSRDPTQDAPPQPRQNRRAQSTDVSRCRELGEKLIYHHR